MFMIVAKQIFMKKVRVREKEEKTAKKENLLSACMGALQKMQENKIHDSVCCAVINKKKKKVIRSMSCRVSSNSLKSQQVCYILHPCAEALFAFVTRDDG